jgi:hypothetical protein
MITIVRKRPRPSSTGFEGAVWVPIACLKKWSTNVIRKKGVRDMMMAGRTVKPVNIRTICIGRLTDVLLPFVPWPVFGLSNRISGLGRGAGAACN